MNKSIKKEITNTVVSIIMILIIGTVGFWLGRFYQYKNPPIEPGCKAPPHSVAALKAMCPGAYVIDDGQATVIFKDGSVTTVYSSIENNRRATIQKEALLINSIKQ